jgi:hypothetical protein
MVLLSFPSSSDVYEDSHEEYPAARAKTDHPSARHEEHTHSFLLPTPVTQNTLLAIAFLLFGHDHRSFSHSVAM